MKSHFHSLPFGVDLIVGMNGYVWVCKHAPQNPDQQDSEAIYSNVNEPIPDELRLLIAQVCRCISLLGRYHWYITDSIIRNVLSDARTVALPEEAFLRAALATLDSA